MAEMAGFRPLGPGLPACENFSHLPSIQSGFHLTVSRGPFSPAASAYSLPQSFLWPECSPSPRRYSGPPSFSRGSNHNGPCVQCLLWAPFYTLGNHSSEKWTERHGVDGQVSALASNPAPDTWRSFITRCHLPVQVPRWTMAYNSCGYSTICISQASDWLSNSDTKIATSPNVNKECNFCKC